MKYALVLTGILGLTLPAVAADPTVLYEKPAFTRYNKLIVLTKTDGTPIAISTDSIISVKQNGPGATVTVIGTTDHWVRESMGQILYIIDPRSVAIR